MIDPDVQFAISRMQSEIDALRAEVEDLRNKVSELESTMPEETDDAHSTVYEQASSDPALVPPSSVDGKSIDYHEEDGDEQIAGFGGSKKKSSTNLALTDYPSSDEFLCRSGDVIAYRKLSAPGGGAPVETKDVEVVVGGTYDTTTHYFTFHKKKLTVLDEKAAPDEHVFRATSHAAEHL